MSKSMNIQPDVFQVFVCLKKIDVDFFMSLDVVSSICCDMLYACSIVTIIDILDVLTQFQSWTCSMAEARVGDHECDGWTVLSECSACKVPTVIE